MNNEEISNFKFNSELRWLRARLYSENEIVEAPQRGRTRLFQVARTKCDRETSLR